MSLSHPLVQGKAFFRMKWKIKLYLKKLALRIESKVDWLFLRDKKIAYGYEAVTKARARGTI